MLLRPVGDELRHSKQTGRENMLAPQVGYRKRDLAGVGDAVVDGIGRAGDLVAGPCQGEQALVDGHLTSDTPVLVPSAARRQPFPGPSRGSRGAPGWHRSGRAALETSGRVPAPAHATGRVSLRG